MTRYRISRRWLLVALGLVLGACNLLTGPQGPTAPLLSPAPRGENPSPSASAVGGAAPATMPSSPVPEAAAPAPTSGNAGGPCLLTARQATTAYNRPSPEAQAFGKLGAGEVVEVVARTEDGWYGFDPGVAQAGNVGAFRWRWIPPTADVSLEGDCASLPVAPALPPGVCFAFATMDLMVYRAPSTSASPVGKWKRGEYAVAVAHGPGDWVLVNLDSGQNHLSGQGWLQTVLAGLNGPCDLPAATALPLGGDAWGEERIRFAPGAVRWRKTLSVGERRFVFAAAQGQSAEILLTRGNQPANAVLLLRAPDGQPLQGAEQSRPDWRGMLPQSGDYHLDISAPEGGEDLTLTVTIYPLPAQPRALTDTGLGFHLVYDGAVFQPQESPYETALALALTREDYFVHTNLAEAFFLLALEPYAHADACWDAPASVMPANQLLDEWVVSGVTYRHGRGSEGAAGNFYDAEVFRTFVHGRCITVYFLVHSADIGNFDPGTVQAYDAQAVLDEFKRLFFTLQWP